jgi:2-polyprenyl-3-methyl-5-hydroxy-6-metoxy-1,4-benzoquinol methylase
MLSTLNHSPRSYTLPAQAIEHVLGCVPRDTHQDTQTLTLGP